MNVSIIKKHCRSCSLASWAIILVAIPNLAIGDQSDTSAAASSLAAFRFSGATRQVSPVIFGVSYPVTNALGRYHYKGPYPDGIAGMMQELGPQIVRGPSGTGSNYWLWKEGHHLTPEVEGFEKFYDWAPPLVKNRPADPEVAIMLSDLLLPSEELDVPYCYSANVIAEDAAGIRELARQLVKKSNGRQVYIELGNELYSIHYRKAFPRARDYMAQASRLYKAIKAVDPSIQVALIAFNPVLHKRIVRDPANYRKTDDHDWEFTVAGRVTAWRREVAARPDVGDAVVIHYYNRIRHVDDVGGQDKVMAHFFAENRFFDREIDEIAGEMGDRPIWITEWNIMIPEMIKSRDLEKKARLQIMKTLGVALVQADLFGTMLADPAITMTAFHSFQSANGFGLIQPERNRKTGRHKDELMKLPAFHTMSLFGRVVRQNPYLYGLQPVGNVPARRAKLQGLDEHVQVEDVGVWILGSASAPREGVLINRTPTSRRAAVEGHRLLPVWQYGKTTTPLEKYPEASLEVWSYPPKKVSAPVKTPDADPVRTLHLPPYSMTVVRILNDE